MQEFIATLRIVFQDNGGVYFWLFLYFGFGFALASLVISLGFFAGAIRDRMIRLHRKPLLANLLILGLGSLSMASLFPILTILRALILGQVEVPKIASIAFFAGGAVHVLAFFLAMRGRANDCADANLKSKQ
jgi:hypothetical protein